MAIQLQRLSGPDLSEKMLHECDFSTVIETATRDFGISHEKARELLHALLQWFSIIPELQPNDVYVMLRSDVDQIYHALILNTKVYRDFCKEYFGEFIDHNPLDGQVDALSFEKHVEFTIALLKKTYGEQLAAPLVDWIESWEKSTWEVSCAKCSYRNKMGALDADTRIGITSRGAMVLH